MSESLRDQLLKAGLVTQEKVRSANQADEQRRRQQKSAGKSRPADAPASAAKVALAQKAARDLELNRRRQEQARRAAVRAQVEQLVEQARLPRLESDTYYSFVDGGKIRRLPVDAPRRKDIVDGGLAIVRCKGHYELVPAEAAQRIRERDASSLVVRSEDEPQPAAPADDPYQAFVVPDDLTW